MEEVYQSLQNQSGFRSVSNVDDSNTQNNVLVDLPAEEVYLLRPKFEFVQLKVGQLLQERGDTLRSAYFVTGGLVSLLSVFPDGKSIEVGLVGKEGFIGIPLICGFPTAYARAVVQIEASAFRIDSGTLLEILKRSPTLNLRLQQYSQIVGMEVARIAACNRLHEVNERLARWLLTSADKLESNTIPLTQETISVMLGVRRSSVTIGAGILETKGLIVNSRGKIDIVNLARLEEAACDCYKLIRIQRDMWRKESNTYRRERRNPLERTVSRRLQTKLCNNEQS